MQHILVLSVIILHHVDSYSCRTVTKLLQQPLEGDTDVTDYTQLKQRDRDITSIIKQLLERSSSEINSEHQKGLAKLTIEPYNKNINKTGWSGKDALHWFDNKKTVAPLAIIVTNLPEITKLEDSDKENKHFIQNQDAVTFFDANQEIKGNSKETSFDRDLHPNVKRNSTEELNNELIDKIDKLNFNIEDLDFSEDENISNYLNKDNNSPNNDVAWQSKENYDKLEHREASNENIYKSIEIVEKTHELQSDTKETIDTFEQEVDNTIKVDIPDNIGINKQDKTLNEDQNVINLLLDTDLEIIKGNANHEIANDSKMNIKFVNKTGDSTIDTNIERKYRDHYRHSSPTYNLFFLFNR